MHDPYSAHASVPSAIECQLSAEERVLWHGRPRQGLVLRAGDAFQIPFTLLWCGLIFQSMRNSPPHDGQFSFSLVNLLFILVGLYLLAGRFLIDIRRRSGTHYAVTGERVLIVARGFQDTATSLPLATLADITLELKPGNAGTIVFGRDTIPFWANAGFIGSRGQTAPRFELIPDARAVHELIRTAQRRTL